MNYVHLINEILNFQIRHNDIHVMYYIENENVYLILTGEKDETPSMKVEYKARSHMSLEYGTFTLNELLNKMYNVLFL
jgi:hypothetical protein